MSTHCNPILPSQFRYELQPQDRRPIGELVAATGKFYPDEVAMAEELAEERLNRGPASGYEFILVDSSSHESTTVSARPQPQIGTGSLAAATNADFQLIGFACYGKIPCTREAFDLYWIAVHPKSQGHGLGRELLHAVEHSIRALGGTQLFADTSGRADYAATRQYYLAMGFESAAQLTDFYAPGDDKVIFRKWLR